MVNKCHCVFLFTDQLTFFATTYVRSNVGVSVGVCICVGSDTARDPCKHCITAPLSTFSQKSADPLLLALGFCNCNTYWPRFNLAGNGKRPWHGQLHHFVASFPNHGLLCKELSWFSHVDLYERKTIKKKKHALRKFLDLRKTKAKTDAQTDAVC